MPAILKSSSLFPPGQYPSQRNYQHCLLTPKQVETFTETRNQVLRKAPRHITCPFVIYVRPVPKSAVFRGRPHTIWLSSTPGIGWHTVPVLMRR